ncbi:DUF2637 domain-containing protein [Streptomyces sp. LNU-CPARS28]|uniref:DUF2637 domain-containing protein n=1 Tax=Streptomyces sp. LNU-CPARS28 TaxID=3137371 RepID=UPI003135C652
MAKHKAERYALRAAGAVIVVLTAGAFWLSYAHLAEVAGQHGLGNSPVRRWAWPATLDAFIVAGELLMLRAGLRHLTDRWAIAVTAIGSAGSIVLNVAGVIGTRHIGTVPFLDYVVAAVPPAAAMLAFGVLMRQIHQLVDHPVDRSHPVSHEASEGSGQTLEPSVVAVQTVEPLAERVQAMGPVAAVSDRAAEPPSPVSESPSRGGRPAKATIEELAEIGRIAALEHGRFTRALLRQAVEDKGLTIGSGRMTKVMKILRPELEAAGITVSTSG